MLEAKFVDLVFQEYNLIVIDIPGRIILSPILDGFPNKVHAHKMLRRYPNQQES